MPTTIQIIDKLHEYNGKIHKAGRLPLLRDAAAKLPKKMGVYVIYYRRKPIYVGRANNIYTRFRSQHLSRASDVASSSFRMHMLKGKKFRSYKEARNWILNNCSVKTIVINDYDYTLLFEQFLIKLWRKKYKLVNDRKGDSVAFL